jgi:uncharacterized protein
MRDLATALALVLVIEGILLALFPVAIKRLWAQMMALPEAPVRIAGLLAACLGVAAVWLIRR